MNKDARIYVAGHRGLVGSAIVRALQSKGYQNLLLKTRRELDLTDEPSVRDFFASETPTHVFDAAAKVGGTVTIGPLPAVEKLERIPGATTGRGFMWSWVRRCVGLAGIRCRKAGFREVGRWGRLPGVRCC